MERTNCTICLTYPPRRFKLTTDAPSTESDLGPPEGEASSPRGCPSGTPPPSQRVLRRSTRKRSIVASSPFSINCRERWYFSGLRNATDDNHDDNHDDDEIAKFVRAGVLSRGDQIESIRSRPKERLIAINDETAMKNRNNYPVEIMILRECPVTTTSAVNKANKRKRRIAVGRKRPRASSLTTTTTSPATPEPQVIEISSDDDNDDDDTINDDSNEDCTKKGASRIDVMGSASTPSLERRRQQQLQEQQFLTDPLPKFEPHEWVWTRVGGAGYVVSSRVDRWASLPLCPNLIYRVQLSFGLAFVNSQQVEPLESSRFGQEIVLRQPQVLIRQMDLVRLRRGVYLNDAIVNYYLQHLRQATTFSSASNNKIHIFNSYFYTKLSQDRISAHGWTKNVDIFGMDFLYIPIHDRLHWSLAVVCHPSQLLNATETSSPQCLLLHLDSGKHFRLHLSATIFGRIRKYLLWRMTDGSSTPQPPPLPKKLQGMSPPVPVQNNTTDCGVYMLEILERLCKNPVRINQAFVQAKGRAPPFSKDWFGSKEVDDKRTFLHRLIVEQKPSNQGI